MTAQVSHTVHDPGPPNRWHPHYDTVREWLDAEAPPTPVEAKKHNRPRYRRITRRG
jgi:hypothetical protein